MLIKALEKAILNEKDQLSFDTTPFTARMLTYNRTLAKYDRYIAELLNQDNNSGISTIDKFLYDKLKLINEDYRIVYDDAYPENLITELRAEHQTGTHQTDTPGSISSILTNKEIAAEIDDNIFAGPLTKEEYLNSRPRLSKTTREKIWNLSQKFILKMKETSSFTKNYSRIIIIDYLKANPGDKHLKDTDFTFIDEVQDLSAIDIRTVKACTKRAVIMAGDADQSIYQSGFTFSKAGIKIRGTTRILRKNFRNSLEIQNIAEKYRLLSSSADPDNQPEAFRTGPPPEHYSAPTENELLKKLTSRVKIFTQDLGYDPENICILVPSSRDIAPLQTILGQSDYQSLDLREDSFSFSKKGIIRISTMHSSKGLDFPVVLLYLHKLPQTSTADNAAKEKMRRNLIYVSMTRAMDQLNIFTLTGETAPEITDLTNILP